MNYEEAVAAVAAGTWTGPVRAGKPQDTVHRPDCKAIRTSQTLPWSFGEHGLSDSEIGSARANGLHFCRKCDASRFMVELREVSQ